MSHIATMQCQIKDLSALEEALGKFNAELRRDQTTFKSYPGTPNRCKHAIRLKDQPTAYEVGLQQRAEADESYDLACDFFDGKLGRAFGDQLVNLRNEYLATVAENSLSRRGYRIRREQVGNEIHIQALG